MIWGSAIITNIAILYVIVSSFGFCLIWGFADGLFYVFENYYTVKKRNSMIDYAKSEEKRSLSHSLVEEELEDSILNVENEADKNQIIDIVVANLAQSEHESHPPYKESAKTILIDMGLNGGAALLILLPIILSWFGLYIQTALYASWIIAIVLMFIIGLWVEESPVFAKKLRYGLYYAALALFILVLIIILTSTL
jgi:hypothetical protein